MRQVNTYRIAQEEITLSSAEAQGMAERELFSSDTVHLKECRSVARTSWSAKACTLYLLTAGELKLKDGKLISQGDLYWCNDDGESFVTGKNGASFYCIEPLQGIGREMPSQTIISADLPWLEFADPAERPTQPVQILLEGSLSVLRTRFDPKFIAGEHWHDFDTLYFISDGRMQFGDEGWFEQGDIRAVHGGHSYGPERPGTEGVEFVLVSVGGPVVLHWSDLEPPP
ncbi:MAG: hypothetical protein V7696_00565 [Halioglobus sp.]